MNFRFTRKRKRALGKKKKKTRRKGLKGLLVSDEDSVSGERAFLRGVFRPPV